MAAALREHGVGETWTWNVDRYIRKGTHPYMEAGDIVLQWQPKRDAAAPAGVYARGIVLDAPCYQPDDDGNWHVQVKILEVYTTPLPSDRIKHDPQLVNLQIIKMAQHRVFVVTPEEWHTLERLLADPR